MQIQSQCCGLILLLFLLFFTIRQKKVGLFTENIFLYTLLLTIVCGCFDIFSIVGLTYAEYLPHHFVAFLCKAYLVFVCWMGFQAFIYTCMDIFSRERYKRNLKLGFLGIIIGTTIIWFLPITMHTGETRVYTTGMAVNATYSIAIAIFIATFYMLFHEKTHMNSKRRSTIILWLGIWISAMLLTFFSRKILLVGYASALCMMVLFFELENPEANFDRGTGLFNAHTLLEYLKQNYDRGQKFSALLLTLPHTPNSHSQSAQNDYAMLEIVKYLQTLPYAKIFKNVEREFFLAFDNEEEMQHDFDLIRQAFQTKWPTSPSHSDEILIEPTYQLLPDSTVAEDADELFWLTRYFKMHSNGLPSNRVFTIDEHVVQQKRKQEEMEHMIVSALEEDRVEVFYQPIYSTHQKKFVSAEALVRIRNTDGSIIPPGLFIGIAEETGLIGQLGEAVFEKVCHFIAKEKLGKYGIEYIEVNLSVTQCEHRNLSTIYKEIMKRYSIDPSYINLEITESASLLSRNILLENMHVLIDYGVSFSLDDFGNGQSNLNYIVDMPVSIVKFDRDMTNAYFENDKARSVLNAANNMIHDMNLKVVSEGVETKEQLNEMIAIGIDYIQGFYFSRPLPQAEFLEFIKKQQSPS